MGTSLSRSLMHSRVVDDPTVMAELYRWSSAEFRDEYALIYTSRSNPSLTCFSHYKVNRDKVLFALSDCLCEGNTVRVDMKFMGDRDYMGRFVLRSADAEDSSGSFMEKIARPGLFLLTYYDKFYHRIGELEMNCGSREAYHQVRFTTGFIGGSLVTYFVDVFCNPLKGLDVNICGPFCEYDGLFRRRPIGSCYLINVSGMPTDDVVKENKQGTTHVMENKQGNDDVGDTDHGSTQRTAILNAGRTQGNFNGSNFRDCKIVVDAQAIQFKDFNNST